MTNSAATWAPQQVATDSHINVWTTSTRNGGGNPIPKQIHKGVLYLIQMIRIQIVQKAFVL